MDTLSPCLPRQSLTVNLPCTAATTGQPTWGSARVPHRCSRATRCSLGVMARAPNSGRWGASVGVERASVGAALTALSASVCKCKELARPDLVPLTKVK